MLRSLVGSEMCIRDRYKKNLNESGNSTEAIANRAVREIIDKDSFWTDLDALLEVLEPAYALLRMVDGVKPTAGKFYYYAQQLQNHYEAMAEVYPWAESFVSLWRADWDYIHCGFHSAGFAVDPEFVSLDKPPEVEIEFLDIAERMLKAAPPELQLSVDNVSSELTKFNNKSGVFAKAVVWRQARQLPGHIWWKKFGAQCPTVRWLAMRILAQTTSAAAAESAWSEFDFVFNRRRNALGKERASNLVFVHCNARLLRRFQSHSFEEPFHPFQDESDDGTDDPMDDE
eukprot:TRINITY_DN6341_c0_g2_i1.p1 TRINITY_DN6341_c0_g2~~TRINITY_DN6341_c0_g2_i1.p1  ORF type:complete len:300 (-),score=76.44 TRINITY_DN6341_c0_g2_i1:24-881(-)